MSRICVPGLLALLAAAPLTWRAAGQAPDPFAPVQAAADEKDDEAEASGHKLNDDEKKALEDFIKKTGEVKKKQFAEMIEKTAAEAAKEAKLDRDAEKKLVKLTDKAVEATMKTWEPAFRKFIEPYARQSAEGVAGIKGWNATSFASNSIPGVKPPLETDEWKAALKEVLSGEQLTARETAEQAVEKKFQEDFGDYLATSEGQAGDQMSGAMESEIQRIVQCSGMDEERQKKLKAAGDAAVKECVKDWRKRIEQQLKTMDEKQREQMTSRGGMFGVNMQEKSDQPKERQVWKDAMTQLLKDEERKLLEQRYLEVRTRRAEALAILLVNDLDRLVGFSSEQRGKFLPLAAERMLKLPDMYFTSPENGGYYAMDPGQMLQQSQKLKDDQIKSILSETQVKRFRSATSDQMSRGNSYMREKLDMGDAPKPEEMDEVEVERLLSRFLHREAKKMKLKMLSTMEAQLEHIRRVTNPAPETVLVLTTAAKGAAEEMAMGSINNLSSWLRGQFQTVKPADVPERLKNLYNPYFNERNQAPPPRLWTSAIERLLTEEQRKLWKIEMETREQWRREGLSAIVITEVEKRIVLREEQRAKLRTKVEAVIAEYEPDFNNYFSMGWHLQGYYSLIPIAMLSDKEMEEHFEKKQIEMLKDKTLGNSLQYVEMIRQNHNSRIKR